MRGLMKKLVFLLIIGILTLNAFASEVPTTCFKKAAKAVEDSTERGYYDHNGFNTNDCFFAPNKSVVICEVSASKGKGDASDTYRVILSKTCSKAFRVELTGEE